MKKPKNILKLSSLIATAITVAIIPTQAATVTWTGAGDGSSWTDGANWDLGVPGAADNMVIGGSAVVNFNTTHTSSLPNGNVVIDLNGTAQLNLTGGSLTFQNGNSNTSPIDFFSSGQVINISGGTHNLMGRVGAGGHTGTLRFTGSTATVNTYQSGSNGTYDFIFDSNGVSSLDYSSWASVGSSAKLTVDGSAFYGDGTFVLLGSSNWLNDFQASNITITGLGAEGAIGVGYTLDQSNGTGVTLTVYVPEPSSAALLGLGGLALMLRRKRN